MPLPPAPATTAPGHYAEPAAMFNDNGPKVHVSLQAVVSALPLELKGKVVQPAPAGVFISMPVDTVVKQLQTGAVKISFGQLRAAAPQVFLPQNNFDRIQVCLPLSEILPQIDPSLLTRRPVQRHVEVPEEVRGPFGGDCNGVSFSAAPTTTGTVIPASPAPAAPEPIVPISPIAPRTPITPIAPMASAAQDPMPMIPAEPIPFRKSIVSTPTPRPPSASPSGPPPARPTLPATRGLGATSSANSVPFPMPAKPGSGHNGHNGHNGSNGHAPAMRLPEPAPAAPVAPAVPEAYLTVPLAALKEQWPEALRLEIAQLNLAQAQLALPMSLIEPALKQGKIVFSWKMLRSWIRPAPLPTVSAHDGTMLELPLSVMAPLFFTRKAQAGQARRKVQVDENIPNLFFGFPQPDATGAAPAPQPIAPAAAATQESEDLLTPVPFNKPAATQETNFYVWGDTADIPQVDPSEFKRSAPGTDFLSRYATPNEVVSRAVVLDGVAGALIALPDGLMVASKLPADLNGDTLAAFLPQIFGKVSQCTKELRMGELNNLNFTVGNVPWKIFRVNAIFFAAFGRAGKGLPTAQLAALAAELNRKK